MSKVDIGVGDEFPLDEGAAVEGRRRGRWGHGHRGRHRHMHRDEQHHHNHRPHGLGRIATLLVIAGLTALIVEHKLPAEAAYGMIALGLAGIVTMILLRWRHHRAPSQQVS